MTISAETLMERLNALERFERAAADHLPDESLAGVREVLARAGTRLRLPGEYTVIALAGSTGSGKSSLFNSLARMELSPAGHLRPTTGQAHACVWGPDPATELLDWLGIDPPHRFRRESLLDAEDEAAMRGLVLVDLPDMDSVATAHRVEVDKLVDSVDLVVWVLDPQKYADRTVHEEYLRAMRSLREVTVVVLNQTDRLAGDDAERCRLDLTRLVEADGLAGVPVLATSAVTGSGVADLRALIEKTVGHRQAMLARFGAELNAVIRRLAPLVAADVSEDAIGRDTVRSLSDALAAASGVGAVAAGTAAEYARRAAVPGPPFRRRRTRSMVASGPAGADARAQPAAVVLAVHRFADQVAGPLPPAWSDRVRAVARTITGAPPGLPDEIGDAVRSAHRRPPRPFGWWLARLVWWLAVLAAVAGAAWYVLDRRNWSGIDRLNLPDMSVRGVPIALIVAGGGLLVAVALPLLNRPLRRARVRRVRASVEGDLRTAVTGLAEDRVVSPVRAVLRDYGAAREALAWQG
jgi:GTP-binding protein EngB required for normal cell division